MQEGKQERQDRRTRRRRDGHRQRRGQMGICQPRPGKYLLFEAWAPVPLNHYHVILFFKKNNEIIAFKKHCSRTFVRQTPAEHRRSRGQI